MLTQDEAERLIAMEKRFEEPAPFVYLPEPGADITIPLVSIDEQESFQLDIRQGRRRRVGQSSNGWMLQLRYGPEVLVRLETSGPTHPNPDDAPNRRLSRYAGQRVETPHIQIYVEGADRPWAFPPPGEFTALDDIVVTWREFLNYCNLIETPTLMGGF